MDTLISSLIDVLQHMQRLYEALLPAIAAEQTAALGSDVQRMVSATAEKEKLLCRLHQLEQRRQGLLLRLASGLGLPTRQLTLLLLSERVDTVRSRELRRLNSSLAALTVQIQQANQESRRLVGHCLRVVQSALSFLNQWMGAVEVYGATGRIHSATGGGRLVSGVV